MTIFSLFLFRSLWPYHFCLVPPLIPFVFITRHPFSSHALFCMRSLECAFFLSLPFSLSLSLSLSQLISLPFPHFASVFIDQCWVQEKCHHTAITTKLYPTLSALLPLPGFDPVCASIYEKVLAEVDMAVKFYNVLLKLPFFFLMPLCWNPKQTGRKQEVDLPS